MSGDSPSIGDATQSSGRLEGDRPPLSNDVFVSYASQDAAVANSVVEALESQGIRCWIAPRDVMPGSLYADEIVGAINDATVVVLVLSEHSINSPHVGKEIERASSKRRRIIALHLDSAALTRAFEYFLSESQWIDVGAGGPMAALPKLVEAVRRHLDPSMAAESHGRLRQQGRRPATPLPKKRVLVGGVMVLAVALVYVVVDRMWISKRIAAEAPVAQPSTAVAFAPPPHSIAVLPFVNMSGDASQEYFSDGISEELLDALSRLDQLHVVARTSSFSFKGQNVDVSTIAHKLNVGAILEGSVRRAGNTARITVQLIDAVTGFHMWSQTYDRRLTDILKVQSEVATMVAQQLKVSFSSDDTVLIEAGGTHIPEAYDAYLSAQQLTRAADTTAEFETARQAVDQAIRLDPNYAAAYALRARLLRDTTMSELNTAQRRHSFDLARQSADRAVVLAPNYSEGHLILGWHVLANGFVDLTGAAREIHRGVELTPGSATAQDYLAGLELVLDHREAAINAVRRAVSLDPLNFAIRHHLVSTLYFTRRFAQVPNAVHDGDALRPGSHSLGTLLVLSYLALGQADRARQACESATTPLDEDDRHFCLTLAYGILRDSRHADSELEKLKALDGPESAPFQYAEIYAQRGDQPSALRWLTKAEAAREQTMLVLRTDWLLDPIRSAPEFKAIEARLNFPP